MIPQTIHHVWVGPPMPEHLAAYRRTWMEHHPEWEHRLWTEQNLTWLQNQELFDRAEDHTEHVGQFRSDVARYEILRLHGGVYVDCDMECLRSFDELCDVEFFAGRECDRFVNNAVLGSVPAHPLLVELVDNLPARVAATRGRGWRPNRITGPHYLTPAVERHGVTVHPAQFFYPYRWDELDRANEAFPDSFAVHHWENARKRRRRPRETT